MKTNTIPEAAVKRGRPVPAGNNLDAIVEDLRRENAALLARTEAAEKAQRTAGSAAEKEAAQLRTRVFANDVEALVNEGRAAGKIAERYAPAFRKLANQCGLEFAREQLAAMPVVIPTTHHEPAPIEGARLYEEMPWNEKARMQEEDPTSFFALRREWQMRTGGKVVAK